MKEILFCICLMLAVAALGFGQDRKVQPEVADNSENVSNSSPRRGILLNAGTSIEAQLQTSVIAKKAKVDDQ